MTMTPPPPLANAEKGAAHREFFRPLAEPGHGLLEVVDGSLVVAAAAHGDAHRVRGLAHHHRVAGQSGLHAGALGGDPGHALVVLDGELGEQHVGAGRDVVRVRGQRAGDQGRQGPAEFGVLRLVEDGAGRGERGGEGLAAGRAGVGEPKQASLDQLLRVDG
ncbi:hypothetical protein [Streptomyces sp. NBC_01443]|uniref:hypothetical protein n=1 Tax=Streptomyces sp. NBC_01443 TaxID=2903868 RepID=UPI002258BF56|nr:hypothetical protein [Streptomyces sp. NBC_01443]MCX4632598.1 hypothetical protein [Streptomyces sp. NBC_01443]